MSLEEELIAKWISEEAAAEQIIQRTEGGYVYHGQQNDYIVEVKAFRVNKERRLIEDDELGYN